MKDHSPLGSPRGGDSSRVQPATFRDSLAELKAGGCNLLVTGEVGADVTDAMSRRLLGSADHPRKRVVVLADRTLADADRVLPAGVAPDDPDVALVDHALSTRSGTATANASAADGPTPGQPTAAQTPRTESDTNEASPDRLRCDVSTALVDQEMAGSGLDPAELRLSLVTLRTLLDRYGVDAVERLVRGVRAHVTGLSGMAHYHLPLPDDAEPVERLAPLFDARIELRAESGVGPEQRWHLPEQGTSPWIRL